jgi:hypothetical protein
MKHGEGGLGLGHALALVALVALQLREGNPPHAQSLEGTLDVVTNERGELFGCHVHKMMLNPRV